MSKKRILYFAPKECWPPDSGAKLRNYYLARELARDNGVTYLGFEDRPPGSDVGIPDAKNPEPPTPAGSARTEEELQLPRLETFCEQVIVVLRDSSVGPMRLLRGALGRVPLTVLNYTTVAMTETLRRLLVERSFDIVQIEGVHLFNYLPIVKASPGRPLLSCDWHNIESELMLRYSDRTTSWPHRRYARLTARRLQRLERQALREFDIHFVCSERERQLLQAMESSSEIVVINNGVDIARQASPFDSGKSKHRILFVGSMDYHANSDAVLQFAREVWPIVNRQHPELIFTIVGRRPGAQVRALADLPGIEVTGTVDRVSPYYEEALAAVVPLWVGSGSRLKILEAMAARVPIVSTSLGAQGLSVSHGETILLADTDRDIERNLLELCASAALSARLTEAAFELVRQHYDWPVIGKELRRAYDARWNPIA